MRLITPNDLDLAVDAIQAGHLVVMPTHRWYMICADASNDEACARIFTGKGRPTSKSLAYVAPDTTSAERTFQLTPAARRLAANFWPGDLALILPWKDPDQRKHCTSVGTPNALVTSDPGPLGQLARRSAAPIAATTVNLTVGEPGDHGPAITTDEVAQFVRRTEVEIAYLIDGGICPAANHLTIMDCSDRDPKTVRPGAIHARAIAAALAGT